MMKKHIFSFVISLGLLTVIVSRVDFGAMKSILTTAEPLWLALGVFMTLPISIALALRFLAVVPKAVSISFYKSVTLVFTANFLNVVLPSKMGDLGKGFFIQRSQYLSRTRALMIVLIEKIIDMIGMFILILPAVILFPLPLSLKVPLVLIISGLMGVGLFLLFIPRYPVFLLVILRKYSPKKLYFISRKVILAFEFVRRAHPHYTRNMVGITLFSAGCSLLHFFQLWCFFKSVYPGLSFFQHLAITPLGTLAGLFPFAVSGIGVRDAALVSLYTPYIGHTMAVLFGLLATLRILVLGFPGLFFLGSKH